MTKTTIALALIFCCAGEALASKFVRRDLNVPGSILWMTSGDLDGDGRTDLVVSYRRGAGPKTARFIAVFFGNENGWSERPEVAIAAPSTAAIFDVGDALGDAKDELMFLAVDGVYAQPFVDRKPASSTRVLATSSLASSPEEEDFVTWDFVRTVLPNEPPMIVVPSRGPLKIFKREADATWKAWAKIPLEQYSSYDAEIPTFRRDRRGASSGRPYSFRSTTIVPLLDFIDQTGDGKIDLVASFEDRLAVYPMLDDGTLAVKPVQSIWFAVRTPEELEIRDATVTTDVLHLDAPSATCRTRWPPVCATWHRSWFCSS
jgi:hypothetical protein